MCRANNVTWPIRWSHFFSIVYIVLLIFFSVIFFFILFSHPVSCCWSLRAIKQITTITIKSLFFIFYIYKCLLCCAQIPYKSIWIPRGNTIKCGKRSAGMFLECSLLTSSTLTMFRLVRMYLSVSCLWSSWTSGPTTTSSSKWVTSAPGRDLWSLRWPDITYKNRKWERLLYIRYSLT